MAAVAVADNICKRSIDRDPVHDIIKFPLHKQLHAEVHWNDLCGVLMPAQDLYVLN